MTNIIDRLKGYAEANEASGLYTEANCANDAIREIEKHVMTLDRIMLDLKFMTEQGYLPKTVLKDFIYQEAVYMMTPEFRKEFENE